MVACLISESTEKAHRYGAIRSHDRWTTTRSGDILRRISRIRGPSALQRVERLGAELDLTYGARHSTGPMLARNDISDGETGSVTARGA